MRHDNYSVYNAERAQLQVINDVLAGQRRAAAHQSYNIINIVSTSDRASQSSRAVGWFWSMLFS